MTMYIEDDDGTIRPAVETFQRRLEQRIAELEAALAERTKERDEAIRRAEVTHTALRDLAINITGTYYCCAVCHQIWTSQPERHAPGCLAAIDAARAGETPR